MTFLDLARLAYIAGMFTVSFDIFLVWHIGPNLRISQLFFAIPMLLAASRIMAGRVKKPLAFGSLAAWAFFIILFIPNSGFILKGLGYGLWLLFNVLLVFSTVQLFGKQAKLLPLLQWYIYSYVFVATFALLQLASAVLKIGAPLIQQWWIPGVLPRINGFSYEASFFATYMITGWVMVSYLISARAEILPAKRLRLIRNTLTAALLISGSRLAWLMMLLWYARHPLLLVWRSMRGKLTKSGLKYSIILFAAICAVILALYVAGPRITQMFAFGTGLDNTASQSVTDRLSGAEDVLNIFMKSPFVGYSLGGLSSAIGKLHGIDVVDFRSAKIEGKGVFLEVLAASGALGFLPFAAYIYALVLSPFRLARKTEDLAIRKLLLGMAWALVFQLIILQFNQNILRPYVWLHIALLSALYQAAGECQRRSRAGAHLMGSDRRGL